MTEKRYVHVSKGVEAPPEVGPDWTVWNAPRPLYGQIEWQGPFHSGVFYAAASPKAERDEYAPDYETLNARQDATEIVLIDDEQAEQLVREHLAESGYTLDDYAEAGMGIADAAARYGIPWHEPDGPSL